MNKVELLNTLYKQLEVESVEVLTENTLWADLDEYDSLAVMSIIAIVDKNFSIKLTAKEINSMEKVGDLLKIVGL